MDKQYKTEHNEYIQNEFNKLVLNDDVYNYSIKIHDGYGNNTRYLKVGHEQLNEIIGTFLIK